MSPLNEEEQEASLLSFSAVRWGRNPTGGRSFYSPPSYSIFGGLGDPQIEVGNFSSPRCALLLEEKEEEGVESASNYPFHLFFLPSQRSSHRVGS